jgi:cytochrome c oxidase subunit I+III
VDEGRFFLPDAEEGKRETLVTSAIDAEPVQCLRVPGPTWLTLVAAIFTGGAFFLATFHRWWLAGFSGLLATLVILVWLWRGTAVIPEKDEKDIGLGVRLPLYGSGAQSVGWWAMFITMLGDITAFAGLVFGYFFYWTVHEDFPPAGMADIGAFWPVVAAGLVLAAWAATLLACRANRRDRAGGFHAAIGAGAILALAGGAALLVGPHRAGLDPTEHVYPAIVWVLLGWTALHVALGVLMHAYCVARRVAGRMTARFDIDIVNTALYWHFVAITMVVTLAVIAGFPLVSGASQP